MKRYYLITILILVMDLLTKAIVRTGMDLHEAIEIIPDYLRLSYVRNTGVAFGLFADFQSEWKPYVLAGMAIVAVGVIVVYSLHMPRERRLLHLALAITMGGILGNFIDRIAHGFVVDFIEFHIYEAFHWPTFNLADSAITIGIGLLLIDTVKNPDFREAELGRG